jgi:Heterokaryon incompatibility protein (HET)
MVTYVSTEDSPYAIDVLPCPESGRDDINEDMALDYGRACLSTCRYVHYTTCVVPPHLCCRPGFVYVGFSNKGVCLVAPSPDDPIEAPYACLSHCWGDSQPLRTTKHTLQTHLEAIQWDQVPKTFQDAICYTRGLGINYIWIDSLCIVQDDSDDWLRESVKMADIYQNAYVTLVASASRSSRDGLYHPPGKIIISYRNADGTTEGVRIRTPTKHPIYRQMDPDDGNLNADFPIFTRAWVFQERILSPRIIHFGPHEMFWECNEHIRCVCDTHRDPFFSDRDLIKSQDMSTKLTVFKKIYADDPASLSSLWRNLVEEYYYLKLTKSSDKLPAITGLASIMMPRREDEHYAAGVWTGSPMDLLWVAKTEHDYSKDDEPVVIYPRASYRTAGWRAPSWSWASVDTDILWALSSKSARGVYNEENCRTTFFFDVEFLLDELGARLKRGEHVKQVTATLKLTGQIALATLFCRHPNQGPQKLVTDQNQILRDCWRGLPSYESWTSDHGYIQLDDPEDLVRLQRGSSTMRVVCMRMATTERYANEYTQGVFGATWVFEYSLILMETKPGSQKYRRVGPAVRCGTLNFGHMWMGGRGSSTNHILIVLLERRSILSDYEIC